MLDISADGRVEGPAAFGSLVSRVVSAVFSAFRRRVFWPVAVATIVEFWLVQLMRPFVHRALTEVTPASLGASAQLSLDYATRLLMFGAAVRPLLFCLSGAMALLFILRTLGIKMNRSKAFTVVATANLTLSLKSLAGYALIRLRGLDAIGGPADLEAHLGLDAFIPSTDALVRLSLSSLNVFDAWFLLVVFKALREGTGVSAREGFAVVTLLWLIYTAARFGLAALL